MTRVYGWQRFYEEAMLDRGVELPRLIRAAHAAIDARLEQLGANGQDRAEELQAIADAQAGLRVLSRELTES